MLLEVSGLSIEYPDRDGSIYAVTDASFAVDAGQTWGIVGESGCGKSTMVRALLGLLPPPGRVTGGSIKFRGRELLGQGKGIFRGIRGRELAFAPQNTTAALNPVVRVGEQFRKIIQRQAHKSSNECHDLAEALLLRAGFRDPETILRSYAHQLSGGMAQRVVLSMSVAHNPALIIADEPTSGLDRAISRRVLENFQRMRDEAGCAAIIVTHDLGVVAQYCSNAIVMYAGQIVDLGPVRSVLRQPRHPYTAALLGAMPGEGRQLKVIGGAVRSLRSRPRACAFVERCSFAADPRCRIERPPLRQVGPDHFAAVFYDMAGAESDDCARSAGSAR
jgi:oligopeptide/dipeptide ABC transporter ATP-binding protein